MRLADYAVEYFNKVRKLTVARTITKMPTIDPVKHGHWIPRSTMVREPFSKNYDCSVCGVNNIQYDYCPYCGAKMDEVSKW